MTWSEREKIFRIAQERVNRWTKAKNDSLDRAAQNKGRNFVRIKNLPKELWEI